MGGKKYAREASREVVWVGEREGVWNSLTKQSQDDVTLLDTFPSALNPLSFFTYSSTLLRGVEVRNSLTKSQDNVALFL